MRRSRTNRARNRGSVTHTKSLGDTTEHITRRGLQREKIRALGARKPVILDAGTPIRDAIRRMRDGKAAGAACVTRDGRLAGIVTERDILMKVLGHDVDDSAPVEQIMTPEPETLTGDALLRDALTMMEHGHYRHIPVVAGDGSVEAMLGQQEVLEYVAEAFPQEILNLPPRPHQTMEKEEGG